MLLLHSLSPAFEKLRIYIIWNPEKDVPLSPEAIMVQASHHRGLPRHSLPTRTPGPEQK